MLVDAEAHGNRFQEMHVDGAVTAPVFTLPDVYLLSHANLSQNLRLNIYILINNKVQREFQLVPDRTLEIAARASASATKSQTRSILYETYDFAGRNRIGFNLTYIELDVPSPISFGFETNYMRALYQYGYEKARTGDFWAKTPPSATADGRLSARPTSSSPLLAVRYP
jgi:hypothetical protein